MFTLVDKKEVIHMDLYILIDVVLGMTFLREYPIGECCECGGNCDPRLTMCSACNAIEDTASEVQMLEELFANTDIVLP